MWWLIIYNWLGDGFTCEGKLEIKNLYEKVDFVENLFVRVRMFMRIENITAIININR